MDNYGGHILGATEAEPGAVELIMDHREAHVAVETHHVAMEAHLSAEG